MMRRTLSLVPLLVVLVACNPQTSTVPDPQNPYAGLPLPLPGAQPEGIFASQTNASVRVGTVTLQSGAIATYVDLNETDGRLEGFALFRGLDKREQRIELTGTSQDGKVSIPLTASVCGQDIDLTLYGTINPATTVNFAGGSRTVKCYGVNVTASVDPFTVNRVPTGGAQ